MPDQTSSTDPNRRCRRCGAAVSRRFIRVFGVEDEVHGCLGCLHRDQLSNGEAAKESDRTPIQEGTRITWTV
ncbi:DUF7563 family protein [Halopenitus persicus]|uniref:DUF7563 family protein n=1 Tax=Halopenitus persicus TaxID=1048396 RepID=UPI000BBB2ABD|nr:hypothetical protein [Halopenitus persicus]